MKCLRLLEDEGLGARSGLDLTSSRLLVGLALDFGVHFSRVEGYSSDSSNYKC